MRAIVLRSDNDMHYLYYKIMYEYEVSTIDFYKVPISTIPTIFYN